MSNQILITILPQNSVTTKNVSFNSDYILITEVSGDSTIFSTVSYFDDPKNPTNPTNVFNSTQTVEQIVAASNNSLVQATVYYQGSFALESALKMAFPVGGYQISPVSGTTNVNSAIRYRGNTYSANEAVAALVDLANQSNSYFTSLESDDTTTLATASGSGLLFAAKANKTYKIVATLWVGCSGTGGIRFGISGPSGAALLSGNLMGSANTAAGANLARIVSPLGSLSGAGATFNRSATATGMVNLTAFVTTGSTAGDIEIVYASATGGETSTIFTGSAIHAVEC